METAVFAVLLTLNETILTLYNLTCLELLELCYTFTQYV